MTDIRDIATFRSSLFSPVLPDECQVNPGRFGAELAFWLARELYLKHGIATSYPDHEDWGWLLSYSTEDGAEFALHCGNIDGTSDAWLVSVRQYGRGLFGRNKPGFEAAAALLTAVTAVLRSEPAITELEILAP